jgi:hypothetical protein
MKNKKQCEEGERFKEHRRAGSGDGDSTSNETPHTHTYTEL